tara:strand:- start:362 stop:2155 length:1794 start_codon:yes stop_codon:yes gene_type:complete
MQQYITKVKRFSTIDSLNPKSLNGVVNQLQHNIDILYNSISLSNKNWNVSELVFGNLLDVNSTGEKVFVNGGRLDSIEKVLSFTPSIGTASYENNKELVVNVNGTPTSIEGEHFLRWDVPTNISNNIVITRNIVIPEQLRHQNILLGFKLSGYIFNEAIGDERFDIYVNGKYVGTGETNIIEHNGLYKMKTIYGNYSLSGSERNLEVKLVRSSTQANTNSDYRIRIQDVFIGLNSLALDQYYLNFPTSSSLDTDISGFYDFDNNSIIPVPKIWTNINAPSTNSDINVTLNPVEQTYQDEYWIAKEATGNGLGTTSDNKMSANDFFNISSFSSSKVTIHLDCSDTYGSFNFDKGGHYDIISNCGDIFCGDILVDNGSVVDFSFDIPDDSNKITFSCSSITIDNKSRLSINIVDESARLECYCNGSLNVLGQSSCKINTGVFGMPLDKSIITRINDHSHLYITLLDSNFQNNDSGLGIGCVVAPVNANKYSFIDLNCLNDLLTCHVSNSTIQDKPVLIKNNSQLIMSGFSTINTFTNDRTFYAFLHSSIEINGEVEFTEGSTCDTSFQKIELGLFSTFGAKTIPSHIEKELIESFVYEL